MNFLTLLFFPSSSLPQVLYSFSFLLSSLLSTNFFLSINYQNDLNNLNFTVFQNTDVKNMKIVNTIAENVIIRVVDNLYQDDL